MSIEWVEHGPRRFVAGFGRSRLLLVKPVEDVNWWLHRHGKGEGHAASRIDGTLDADAAKAAAEAVAAERWPDL